MKLFDDKFFGPQDFTMRIIEYPPYAVDVKARRWGYETGKEIYDVIYLKRPVWNDRLQIYIERLFKINGMPDIIPHKIHKEVIKKFGLE